ncbi:hypothetical protein [Magnetospirillum gryphiswaldense]|uniref:Secreted protein n=1 Tax=Magnetospirillum gryphiswaldense TaxID=55518 RepID=A4U024_9PROT|nr:hypothetical protein [Magnetospirillum gryphiswaldense]AVM74582.1 hypothetical protein MSR1_20940 [Magnetospirillum gryphiswaldense MSR-1]AVM78485.1 hypothetical protein MSR1L_20940 [Magnetospirillum gryphiswaldense]CAM76231.1 secreted protein [Magnetospirillum gryphiswaldense MSR-1]
MSGIRQNLGKILIGLVFFGLLVVVAAPASHAAASRATVMQPPRQGLADLIRKPTKKPEQTRVASRQDELPRPLSSVGLLR